MSFRDLRMLTENLRVLGYTNVVSLDSFREPNFPLVADLLIWLSAIYEPGEQIPHSIDSEHDRVTLIKTVSQIFAKKQHMRINAKRLYQADGYAVKELLKLVNTLVEACSMAQGKTDDDTKENEDGRTSKMEINATLEGTLKASDMKLMREKVAEISRSGAALHEELSTELRCRNLRQDAIGRPLELRQVEKALKDSKNMAQQTSDNARKRLENVTGDQQGMQSKIEKKKAELERTQKRLKQLKQLRPPFQDELEALEGDLKELYDEYCVKHRNSVYLESLLEELKKNRPQQQQIFVREGIGANNEIKLDGPGFQSDEDLTSDDDDLLMGQNRPLYDGEDLSDEDDDLTDDDDSNGDILSNEEDDF